MSRTIQYIFTGRPTLEGAGVKLHRIFGSPKQAVITDPFLLLDDFSADDPDDYLAGFPWHPHRGIETVTYMLAGNVRHGDSLGNKGEIRGGEVQWMTAGSGIIHEELPQRSPKLQGFQLWVNLPRQHKMMRPRYQGVVAADIPTVQIGRATVKVICGRIADTHGPVQEVMAEPLYADVTLPAGQSLVLPIPKTYTVLVYVYVGEIAADQPVTAGHCAVFGSGETLTVTAVADAQFLVIAGQPLHEPIAWAGPIVMNTEQELERAFAEYESGTFIK
jgi:redox-sensitive bicupin YhaK (pirin superfamily)